jgi:hypothetical protein
MPSKGYLFGHETPCTCGCSLCTTGSLPETITVTFSGIPDLQQSDPLVTLSTTSCFGTGATGRLTSPGGYRGTDEGPASGTAVTNPGWGYAIVARVTPAGSVEVEDDEVFTPTWTEDETECGIPWWSITSVAVTPGASGFVDGEQLDLIVDGDVTEDWHAVLIVRTVREEPDIDVEAYGGTGATFTGNLALNPGPPQSWYFDTIDVDTPGTGYTDNETVGFTPGPGVTAVSFASARIRTVRAAPTIVADLSAASGTGGALSVTLASGTDYEGRDIWGADTLGIDTAGTGYAVDDPINFTVTDGQEVYAAYGRVSSVGGSGEITGHVIDSPGEYFKDTGVVDIVVIDDPGEYFLDTGEPESVEVVDGGKYWIDDMDAPPYVADVTVDITQDVDGIGSGAVITATIDDDPYSPTFGRITAFPIDTPGVDYLAWAWRPLHCCGSQLNDISIVLKRSADDPCYYDHIMCGGWRQLPSSNSLIRSARLVPWARYRGPSSPPLVGIIPYRTYIGSSETSVEACGLAEIEADSPVADCGDMNFVATGPEGIEAVVEPGGEYDQEERDRTLCHALCHDGGEIPDEITVRITAIAPGAVAYEGDHVLGDFGSVHVSGDRIWQKLHGGNALIVAHLFPGYGNTIDFEEGTCPRKPHLTLAPGSALPFVYLPTFCPGFIDEISPCRPPVGYTCTWYTSGEVPWATAEVVA